MWTEALCQALWGQGHGDGQNRHCACPCGGDPPMPLPQPLGEHKQRPDNFKIASPGL